jgi:hypothetical protein
MKTVRPVQFHAYVENCICYRPILTASVAYWAQFLSADSEDPGSIPGISKFAE